MGYYGAFLGLHIQNDLAMTRALDADQYESSNALTIAFPVSIPYMPDQSEFVRVKGQFMYQGYLYRMVKQKYARDTLTVVCVRDTKHKEIDLALADYVKNLLDNSSDTKSPTKFSISFIKDYLPNSFLIGSATKGWISLIVRNLNDRNLLTTYSKSFLHPPERS